LPNGYDKVTPSLRYIVVNGYIGVWLIAFYTMALEVTSYRSTRTKSAPLNAASVTITTVILITNRERPVGEMPFIAAVANALIFFASDNMDYAIQLADQLRPFVGGRRFF
jgi:hypothetical protein